MANSSCNHSHYHHHYDGEERHHREDDEVSDTESVVINGSDLVARDNKSCYVMDLFQQQLEQSRFVSDSFGESDFGHVEDNCEVDLDHLELDLGLGFHDDVDSDGNDVHNVCGDVIMNCDFEGDYARDDIDEYCDPESVFASSLNGVSVDVFESDCDIEENLNSLDIDLNSVDEYGLDGLNVEENDVCYNEDGDGASVTIPLCWDSLQLEDPRENNEDFEWEEVDEGVDEREVSSLFVDDEEASVSLSVSPIIAPEDLASVERMGGSGTLEWEVLLNANDLDSFPDQDHNAEPYFGEHDVYIYTAEYEMLFGQFAENEHALIGRPPASKTVVESLPSLVLTKEDVESDNALCAVCKDGMDVGDMAKQLPCTHRYHGDCILPWLGIRNTCPVCRFELPTDDPDYESRKAAQGTSVSGRRTREGN